jgi:hypothetical protein
MWAPSQRVGSDDHHLYDVEDEPGTELMSFGPHAIAGGATQYFQMQPQKPVRPKFLWIHPRCSDHFRISSIRLGVTIVGEAAVSDRGISGSLFSRGRGFPLETDVMMPGILFAFQASNYSVHSLNFEGVWRVMPLKDPPQRRRLELPEMGPWGPQIVGLKK